MTNLSTKQQLNGQNGHFIFTSRLTRAARSLFVHGVTVCNVAAAGGAPYIEARTKLTPLEMAIGRFGLHRDIAFRLIMSDYDRSLVWRALLFDGEGWSAKSLAAHLRLPRSTVSRYTAYLVKLGHLERRDRGLYLTEGGRAFLTDVFRCGLEIANGQREGWPAHIVERAQKVGYCHEDAATISFKSGENFEIN